MPLWDGYDGAGFVVVRNLAGQYSIWPAAQGLPDGWETVAGPADKAECLKQIETMWTGTRPVGQGSSSWSVVAAPKPVDAVSVTHGRVEEIPELPVHLLAEQNAAVPGSSIALRCGGERVSRDELFALARDWAQVLVEEGCGRDVPVALLMPRGIPAITLILATLFAGGAYVPLSVDDPHERLLATLDDCGQPLTVAADDSVHSLDGYPGRVITASELRVRAEKASGDTAAPPLPSPHLDDLAFVIYTSGTTGRPKGVEGTHRQLANYAQWCRAEFPHGPDERTVLHAPLAFLGSLTNIFTPLLAGWPIDVAPEGATVDDVLKIAGPQTGLLKLTPTHIRMMLARGAVSRRLARHFMIGSEPLVMTHGLAEWVAALPDSTFVNHYGLTETHGAFCHHFGTEVPVGDTVPIGTPVANVRARIVDEYGAVVPTGEVGELLIAGTSIGRGYRNRPALTAERWIPDAEGPAGTRVLRTGDLARMRADGVIQLVGRADRQIKIRGHRVEPGSVESALRAMPGVADALVVPRTYGDTTALVAYLVRAADSSLDAHEIHRGLAERLPAPSVPSRIAVLDAFPVNANGKLDVSALPEAPPVAAAREAVSSAGERWTRHALVVADAFAAALDAESLELDDDFFDLGGDSMAAVEVAMTVGERFGCEDVPVPTRNSATVRAYSEVVATAVRAAG